MMTGAASHPVFRRRLHRRGAVRRVLDLDAGGGGEGAGFGDYGGEDLAECGAATVSTPRERADCVSHTVTGDRAFSESDAAFWRDLVRTAGFEPATSGISGRRLCRLGYVRGSGPREVVRAGGFEPPLSSL